MEACKTQSSITDECFPPFRPHPLIRNGHAQTVVSNYFPAARLPSNTIRYEVPLPDGDALVLHEDSPAAWAPGDRIVLMMHGLGGCHRSGYLVRIAGKFIERGTRTIRMDLRGYGDGIAKARGIGHAGRDEDVSEVVDWLVARNPGSRISLIGFSMSANIALKYLGERGDAIPEQLDSVVAVAPPIDLIHCGHNFRRGVNRVYDWSFMRWLHGLVHLRHQSIPGLYDIPVRPLPRRLWQFDDKYTAPLSGFSGVEEYYTKCSAGPLLHNVSIPTLILSSGDDPMIPASMFHRFELSSSITLHLTTHGGHCGFIGVPGVDADTRWMDWRIIDWVQQAEQTSPS